MRARSITSKSLSLLLILGCPAPSAAGVATNSLFTTEVAQKLNTQLTDIMHRYNLPSVAVGVEVPGKGRYTFVNGFANLQTRLPRRLDQPFRIVPIEPVSSYDERRVELRKVVDVGSEAVDRAGVNRSQTTPVYELVGKTILTELKPAKR